MVKNYQLIIIASNCTNYRIILLSTLILQVVFDNMSFSMIKDNIMAIIKCHLKHHQHRLWCFRFLLLRKTLEKTFYAQKRIYSPAHHTPATRSVITLLLEKRQEIYTAVKSVVYWIIGKILWSHYRIENFTRYFGKL